MVPQAQGKLLHCQPVFMASSDWKAGQGRGRGHSPAPKCTRLVPPWAAGGAYTHTHQECTHHMCTLTRVHAHTLQWNSGSAMDFGDGLHKQQPQCPTGGCDHQIYEQGQGQHKLPAGSRLPSRNHGAQVVKQDSEQSGTAKAAARSCRHPSLVPTTIHPPCPVCPAPAQPQHLPQPSRAHLLNVRQAVQQGDCLHCLSLTEPRPGGPPCHGLQHHMVQCGGDEGRGQLSQVVL